MKKSTSFCFAFALLLVSFSTLFSQAPAWERNDLLSPNLDFANGNQRTTSHDDLPSYMMNFSWRNNQWDTVLQANYTYDINGRALNSYFEYYFAGVFTPLSFDSTVYLNNGLTVRKYESS